VAPRSLTLFSLPGVPIVQPGDDIASLIIEGVGRAGETLQDGDIVVIAQKVVSKSEGRFFDLHAVVPSDQAIELAEETDKDARLVELILSESERVLRYRKGVLIVVHRLGFVLANAGIDRSNVGPNEIGESVLLLPKDPDASCKRIRDNIRQFGGVDVAIVMNDSLGRAWRNGTTGVALGAAGLPALMDLRGQDDLFGRPLEATQLGLADEIASAASLLQGQADEGTPFVVLRGMQFAEASLDAGTLIRNIEEDLFR
tara:strand:- start:1046 stop:1816 length:771 start_codon:yes stop_codon:yes gene_type:complete